MTTRAQLLAWLKSDNAKRCVLVEAAVMVAGASVDSVRYLSNRGYTTSPTDSPANTYYHPIISGGVSFTEGLSLSGEVKLSAGVIELVNNNGSIDSWSNDIWQNRAINIYIGDVSWARTDFYLIFSGVVASQPTSDDRKQVVITLSDKLQRLNTTLSDIKLGGPSLNKDKLIPHLFGECFNISPLLVDLATHTYQIHNGPIEYIIEVRDNGIPVKFTSDLATGTFKLLQQPAGTITCDAQGDKPTLYVNDPVGLIKRLVKDFGPVSTRFTDAELYLTGQDVPGAVVPAEASAVVGEYITEKTNLLDLCNKIASSIGARVAMTRTGQLYIVRIHLPQPSIGTVVTASEMHEKSLYVTTVPVVAGVKLGYCKNYTTQTGLQTGLPNDQIDLFAKEWPFTSTYSNADTASAYKLPLNPTTVETSLQSQYDADLETARRGALFGTQRHVAAYDGTPSLLLESLGAPHTIQHQRFSLLTGKTGMILSLNTDWLAAKVSLEVLF